MEDILFRNRNKEYGAYMLRRKYPRVLILSTFITVFVFVFGMLLYVYWPEPKGDMDEISYFSVGGDGVQMSVKPQQTEPPQSGGFYKPLLVPEVIDSVPQSDTLINQAEGNGTDTTGAGNGNGSGDGGGPVLLASQQPPSFPGGEKDRTRFLQQNIIYPPAARKEKVQGVVYVCFIVEKNGSLSQIKILKGIGHGCDEEALRVVNSMPRWIPGKQNGSPVRVQVVIPLHFKWTAA